MEYSYLIDIFDKNRKLISSNQDVSFDRNTRVGKAEFKNLVTLPRFSQFYMFQVVNFKPVSGVKTDLMPLNIGEIKKNEVLEISHILDISFLYQIGMLEKPAVPAKNLESIMETLIFNKEI